LAENIRAEVARRPLVLENRTLMLTMSFGLALATHDGRNLGAYMSAADAALLDAKRQGRNRVSVSAGS
jgi:GGDEF domain-containing protein